MWHKVRPCLTIAKATAMECFDYRLYYHFLRNHLITGNRSNENHRTKDQKTVIA